MRRTDEFGTTTTNSAAFGLDAGPSGNDVGVRTAKPSYRYRGMGVPADLLVRGTRGLNGIEGFITS